MSIKKDRLNSVQPVCFKSVVSLLSGDFHVLRKRNLNYKPV